MRARSCAVMVSLFATLLGPSEASAQAAQPTVVVAVADSGVNPYHEIYYRPELTEHPCTWVAGYDDCSIPALDLSIGEYENWQDAYDADKAIWDSVELHRWYWIPQTNIIGAVCNSTVSGPTDLAPELACILDDNGHGTGTTSSVLTENPEALLLVHEGNSGAHDLEFAPVTPDVQSHSWGPAAPLPLHAADPVWPGDAFCASPPFDPSTLFFIAAGNEAPFPTILDCSRVWDHVNVVGGGFPGYWETSSWSLYDFASWYCRPTATHRGVSDMRPSYCGTSFAAPTAAGAVSKALLDVRRADGYTGRSSPDMVSATVSRETFMDAVRRGATYAPASKFPNGARPTSVPLPDQGQHLFWGYGWLDSTIADAITDCALGRACPEIPADARTYHENRMALRRATSEDAIPSVHDDAGSGRDAPDGPTGSIRIFPGTAYTASTDGFTDSQDWYVFSAGSGQEINAALRGLGGCAELTDRDGNQLDLKCTDTPTRASLNAVASYDGDYYLSYLTLVREQYSFGFGLDAPPPAF